MAAAIAVAGLLVIAFGGAARAAEPSAGACITFCAPVAAGKLDDLRAQGLDGTADANIRLSVILWDETRRQNQPATGSVAGASVSLPGPMPVSLTSGGTLGLH